MSFVACPFASRAYAAEQDLQQMEDLLMEARSRTNDWRYWHVGDLVFAFFMVACHLRPQEHIRLWHNGEGKLVGYAMLGEDPSFDYQVLPEYAWSGIEEEAMAWAETRLAELRARDAQRWGGGLVAVARQDDAQRIAFLQQHGFRYSDRFAEVNLLRSLGDLIPEVALPSGYWVCAAAETGVVSDRAAIQHDVWHPWTVGNISGDDYAYLMQLPGYHRDLDVVTVAPDGVIAAYVNGWIDPINHIGDLGPVGARVAYRRQGLTRAALLECLRRMRVRGMDRVCVATGVLNAPALRLYESVGFRVANVSLNYVKLV